MFGAGGAVRNVDVAIGTREQGVDLGSLLGDWGERATFQRALGARVLGGGDRFGDGFGHGVLGLLTQRCVREGSEEGFRICKTCLLYAQVVQVLYD